MMHMGDEFSRKSNPIQEAYPNKECPDCGEPIPEDVQGRFLLLPVWSRFLDGKKGRLMSIKVTCPKNKRHSRFSVTAHVVQEWKVGKDGKYVATLNECMEVTHRPEKGDLFLCCTCGAEATVE